MIRDKKLAVCLCALLTFIINAYSVDEDLENEARKTEDSTALRDKCESIVISESVVIVNCSHTNIGSKDGLDIINIDNRVTTLDFSSSKMINIPFQYTDSVKNLVHLNLSNNYLAHVDELKTTKFESLRHLDLSQNKLRKIPFCYERIVSLIIDFNEITFLDLAYDIVSDCRNLQKLSVAGNLIDVINATCDTTDASASLEYLDLSSNRINHIGTCMFKQVNGLVYLNLSRNSISHISDGVFKTVTQLEKIDLSYNSIEFIAANTFEKLKDLKFLDLSFNKLQVIPITLPMMDWFDVSFNRITTLPESFSTALFPQSVFLIGGNPFLCNCDLLWLKEVFDTRKYLLKYLKNIDRTKFIPACEGPETLRGEVWDSLDDAAFECSRLEEKDKLAIKENVKQVLTGKDLIEVSEIGEDFVIVQWNIPPDLSSSVELTYHVFGHKKDGKEIILPTSVTNFRLKKLEVGTPYVICLKVTLTKELKDCIEIITKVTEETNLSAKIIVYCQNFLHFCKTRYDITALTIGLLSLIYYFCLRENGNK